DVGELDYRVLDLVDLGDFIGVEGRVMRTRKGELSVQARGLTFLGKALLPLPEKWHGLADVEVRYRQRYVDLVANPEVRRTFAARSALIAAAVERVVAGGEVSYKGRPIRLRPPFARVTMKRAVARAAAEQGIRLDPADLDRPEALEAWTESKALSGRRNPKGVLLGKE